MSHSRDRLNQSDGAPTICPAPRFRITPEMVTKDPHQEAVGNKWMYGSSHVRMCGNG